MKSKNLDRVPLKLLTIKLKISLFCSLGSMARKKDGKRYCHLSLRHWKQQLNLGTTLLRLTLEFISSLIKKRQTLRNMLLSLILIRYWNLFHYYLCKLWNIVNIIVSFWNYPGNFEILPSV